MSRCIIKVNGDYLSDDIRNTGAYYPRETMDRLTQVFDDFGLVVCGWPAQWDTALVNCLGVSRPRRYSLFWMIVEPPSKRARMIVTQKGGTIVEI